MKCGWTYSQTVHTVFNVLEALLLFRKNVFMELNAFNNNCHSLLDYILLIGAAHVVKNGDVLLSAESSYSLLQFN